MTSEETVQLLINRFPFVVKLVETPEDVYFSAPFYIYERFSEHLRKHHTDEEFLVSVCQFIDDLANSSDSFLHEVLGLSILESVAQDVALADKIKSRICEKSKGMLKKIESDLYGR